jgi:hypothetical protein
MSILTRLTTGLRNRAQKIIIYAPEGFGKSTLASRFPAPLFLDLEDSTSQLDVTRLAHTEISCLDEFESALTEIVRTVPCATLVVDTADWLEVLIADALVGEARNPRIRGIEDFGYGKGYTLLKERMTCILAKLDTVIAAGITVVLLAHAKATRFEPPEGGASPYDRYELKLSKQVAPLVKEWADMLLFGNWREPLHDKSGSDSPASATKERLMGCTHTAAWDAKNRHNLPDIAAWDIATIQNAFRSIGIPWPNIPSPSPIPPTPSPLSSQSNLTKHPANDPELARICEPHAEPINRYLIANHRIKAGEDWRSMPSDFANRVKRNPAGFLKIINGQVVAA